MVRELTEDTKEFIVSSFKPGLANKILSICEFYLRSFPSVQEPEVNENTNELELVFRAPLSAEPHPDKRDILLAIRRRDMGERARLSFSCGSDHGFDLGKLEREFGADVKIEPYDGLHSIRILIDSSFDADSDYFLEFIKKAYYSRMPRMISNGTLPR